MNEVNAETARLGNSTEMNAWCRQAIHDGATRLRTHNQKMTVAAMQMALMKAWAQRS